MATKYLDYAQLVQPAWLRAQAGADALHAGKGDTKDDILERMKDAVLARMTLRSPTDGLQWIGDERGIARGVEETDAAYALRLQHAWDIWPHAGTALGVLNALHYAGYTVVLTQFRKHAFTLDGTGALVITPYPTATPYWTIDGDLTLWSRFTVLFQPPYPSGWRTTGTGQTYAASASSSFGVGDWVFTGSLAADTRIRIVCVAAGHPLTSSTLFALSYDNGVTWTHSLTAASVIASIAALSGGLTLSISSNTPSCLVGDSLYVHPTFTIPADGSSEATFIKSLVRRWQPVGAVARYTIPTSGRTLGWPVTQQLGVADGSGVVVRLGGGTEVTWAP